MRRRHTRISEYSNKRINPHSSQIRSEVGGANGYEGQKQTSGATHRYHGTGRGKEYCFTKVGSRANPMCHMTTRHMDMGPGQVQRYFEPPADDGKVLAKRFARGGIRTRDLQHGTVGAAYHYTTRSHSNFWRSRSAQDQNRNSEKAERCGLLRAIGRDKDREIWLR